MFLFMTATCKAVQPKRCLWFTSKSLFLKILFEANFILIRVIILSLFFYKDYLVNSFGIFLLAAMKNRLSVKHKQS